MADEDVVTEQDRDGVEPPAEQPAPKSIAQLNATHDAPGTVSGVQGAATPVARTNAREERRQELLEAAANHADDHARLAEIELSLAEVSTSTHAAQIHVGRAQVHATLATVQA